MFGFPKVEHKKFQKNFLRSVIFQISFENTDILDSKSKEIQDFFKEELPRFTSSPAQEFEISFTNLKSASFQQNEKGTVLNLRSLDGEKIMNITESQITLTLSGKVYESFKKINFLLKKIIILLEKLSISYVDRVAIRKINIIEFKLTNNDDERAPVEILQQLLNPQLTNGVNFVPNRKYINHYIQSLNYNSDENFLNIKYGLNIPEAKKNGQVIIDIDLFSKTKVSREEIEENAENINSEIFNIFNWVVNNNTIKILEQ